MDIAWLYVSRSTLRLPGSGQEIDHIVDWSRHRNAELEVTGALVFTETHFAQYLEGPEASIDALAASIRRDPRHMDLRVIFRRPLGGERQFGTWTLAYAGPSTFVAAHVLTVAEAGEGNAGLKGAERLVALMRQFVSAQLMEAERKRAG
jgi:hypothetical protein